VWLGEKGSLCRMYGRMMGCSHRLPEVVSMLGVRVLSD
jgi:hypothetical protein